MIVGMLMCGGAGLAQVVQVSAGEPAVVFRISILSAPVRAVNTRSGCCNSMESSLQCLVQHMQMSNV
jgi:hypothetical protein